MTKAAELLLARLDTIEEGGFVFGVRVPTIEECIVAGGIPMPVLRELERKADQIGKPGQEDLTLEEMEAGLRLNRQWVQQAIKTIDGEWVTLEDDDLDLLPPEAFASILAYARREKDALGKASPGRSPAGSPRPKAASSALSLNGSASTPAQSSQTP